MFDEETSLVGNVKVFQSRYAPGTVSLCQDFSYLSHVVGSEQRRTQRFLLDYCQTNTEVCKKFSFFIQLCVERKCLMTAQGGSLSI